MATASSSPSWASTTTTGPKASSRTACMSTVQSASRVGATK